MKNLRFLIPILLLSSVCLAEGPLFQQKEPSSQQEFENVYQDLRRFSFLTNNTSGQFLVGQGNGNRPIWQTVQNRILQVQLFTITSSSSSSASGVDVRSPVTGTITPSTTTSTIYIFMTSPVRINGTSLTNGATAKLYRNNTTDLTPNVGYSNVTPQVASQNFDGEYVIVEDDQPNTVSATTYTMYWTSGSSANTVTLMVGNQTACVLLVEVGRI